MLINKYTRDYASKNIMNIAKQYVCRYFINYVKETINYYILAFILYEIDNNINV